MGVRNFKGGFPDADPNSTFGPYQRRGTGGSVTGKYQEMMQTHSGIASAVYWSITEAASLPKEVVWPHTSVAGAEEKTFMHICKQACIEEAVVFDGTLSGANALWQYVILDAFMGFGLMLPRLLEGNSVEWYPVAHSSVMLWDPEPQSYFLRGVKFSTGQGYANVPAADLVHVVHGTATAGEWEGRSILRSLLQPYELWKQTALNAGIYNQMSWGFLDVAYDPSVSTDDIEAMNTLAGQFQDGVRKYILRPRSVDVEMKYPKGAGPDVIGQLTYYDTLIQRMLNDNLAGIGQFGSRAMAETVDDAAGRRAKAWVDGIFERASTGMFGWLAKAHGYEGKLPILRSQSAELTTGLDGWAAYVQGVQAGLLTKGPDDEAWARNVIGAPEMTEEKSVDKPASLLVGSLQVAQQVLLSLQPSPTQPVPLAPQAAFLLLQSAGIQEDAAKAMVAAQMGVPVAAPVAAEPAAAAPVADGTVKESLTVAPVAPETAPSDVPQVVIGGNVEVPAAIGESSAFAPAAAEPPDAKMADDVNTAPTDDMADEATLLVASMSEAPDSLVPTDVMEVAAAALEAHRLIAKGRTTDTEALLIARELAGGKVLSWRRVMKLAEYFGREYPRQVETKSFKSGGPSYHAYQLRGGDAGRRWVRSLLMEYAQGAHRRASRLSDRSKAGAGDLADGEGEGFLVVGGDGKEFVNYRPLRPEEKVVSWVSLADSRAVLDELLTTAILAIADEHRLAVIAGLADGWQAGERDAIYNKYLQLYSAALTTGASELRKNVIEGVVDEAKLTARSGLGIEAKPSAQIDDAVKSFQAAADQQFALAAAATQKAAEIVTDRVQGEVEQALLGGADMSKFKTRITTAGLMTSTLQPRNMVESASRAAGYAQTPAALASSGLAPLVPDRVIRSSINDADRCHVCESMDGKEYNVRDFVVGTDLQLPPLPDPDCLGGAGRCRCGYIGLYD
jgi:hypothetical protein